MEHVLLGNHRAYTKTPRLVGAGGRRLFGNVLLTRTADAHITHRRKLAPAFHRKVLTALAEHAVSAAAEVADGWHDGQRVDVEAEMARLARRAIRHTLFGPDSSAETTSFDRAVETRTRYIERIFRLPAPPPWPLPSTRHRRAMHLLERTIDDELRAPGRDGEPPLLQLLAEALGARGAREETVMLLVTGHETLGLAITWTLYALAERPELEQRLIDEVDATSGERDPTPADLVRLGYCERVFDESLRLYPPTWLFVRIALEDDVLPSGAAIERGFKLYLSPYVLHRDPRLFPDPDRFDPDRERPDPAYFPFGGGPRLCIGKPFARASAVLALATIARRARLELAPGTRVTPIPRVTLRPRGGLPMRVCRR